MQFISSQVCTILVLNYHHRLAVDDGMPPWFRKVFLQWIPWALRMSRPGNKITRRSIYLQNKVRTLVTPGETENEWQKTEQVPILLLRGARSFFDAKKMKKKILLAWTSEIIQFIRYPIQMDRTERSNFFWGGKCWLFIVIQLCYSGLWPFSH